jgi:hypothetical protein
MDSGIDLLILADGSGDEQRRPVQRLLCALFRWTRPEKNALRFGDFCLKRSQKGPKTGKNTWFVFTGLSTDQIPIFFIPCWLHNF